MVEQVLVVLVVKDSLVVKDYRRAVVDYTTVEVDYTTVGEVECRTSTVVGYNLYKNQINK